MKTSFFFCLILSLFKAIDVIKLLLVMYSFDKLTEYVLSVRHDLI